MSFSSKSDAPDAKSGLSTSGGNEVKARDTVDPASEFRFPDYLFPELNQHIRRSYSHHLLPLSPRAKLARLTKDFYQRVVPSQRGASQPDSKDDNSKKVNPAFDFIWARELLHFVDLHGYCYDLGMLDDIVNTAKNIVVRLYKQGHRQYKSGSSKKNNSEKPADCDKLTLTNIDKKTYARSLHIIGQWYLQGSLNVTQDLTKAVQFFTQSAKLGGARSYYQLGIEFELVNEPALALKYYQLGASDKYHDAACHYRLAIAYLRGGQLGLPANGDPERGLEQLCEAVKSSDTDCAQPAYLYGLIQLGEARHIASPNRKYIMGPPFSRQSRNSTSQPDQLWGRTTTTNGKYEANKSSLRECGLKAIEYAAWLGFPLAMIRMGKAWQNGECGFNPMISLVYFYSAARQQQFQHWQSLQTSKDDDTNRPVPNLNDVNEAGGVAELEIAKWFLSGDYNDENSDLDINEEWAYEFTLMAARLNNEVAEFAMGYYYEVGIHVNPDIYQAQQWYTQASYHGSEDATRRLQELRYIFQAQETNDTTFSNEPINSQHHIPASSAPQINDRHNHDRMMELKRQKTRNLRQKYTDGLQNLENNNKGKSTENVQDNTQKMVDNSNDYNNNIKNNEGKSSYYEDYPDVAPALAQFGITLEPTTTIEKEANHGFILEVEQPSAFTFDMQELYQSVSNGTLVESAPTLSDPVFKATETKSLPPLPVLSSAKESSTSVTNAPLNLLSKIDSPRASTAIPSNEGLISSSAPVQATPVPKGIVSASTTTTMMTNDTKPTPKLTPFATKHRVVTNDNTSFDDPNSKFLLETQRQLQQLKEQQEKQKKQLEQLQKMQEQQHELRLKKQHTLRENKAPSRDLSISINAKDFIKDDTSPMTTASSTDSQQQSSASAQKPKVTINSSSSVRARATFFEEQAKLLQNPQNQSALKLRRFRSTASSPIKLWLEIEEEELENSKINQMNEILRMQRRMERLERMRARRAAKLGQAGIDGDEDYPDDSMNYDDSFDDQDSSFVYTAVEDNSFSAPAATATAGAESVPMGNFLDALNYEDTKTSVQDDDDDDFSQGYDDSNKPTPKLLHNEKFDSSENHLASKSLPINADLDPTIVSKSLKALVLDKTEPATKRLPEPEPIVKEQLTRPSKTEPVVEEKPSMPFKKVVTHNEVVDSKAAEQEIREEADKLLTETGQANNAPSTIKTSNDQIKDSDVESDVVIPNDLSVLSKQSIIQPEEVTDTETLKESIWSEETSLLDDGTKTPVSPDSKQQVLISSNAAESNQQEISIGLKESEPSEEIDLDTNPERNQDDSIAQPMEARKLKSVFISETKSSVDATKVVSETRIENTIKSTSSVEKDFKSTSSVSEDIESTPSVEKDIESTSSVEKDTESTSSVEKDTESTSSVEKDTESTSSVEKDFQSTSFVKEDIQSTSSDKQDHEGTEYEARKISPLETNYDKAEFAAELIRDQTDETENVETDDKSVQSLQKVMKVDRAENNFRNDIADHDHTNPALSSSDNGRTFNQHHNSLDYAQSIKTKFTDSLQGNSLSSKTSSVNAAETKEDLNATLKKSATSKEYMDDGIESFASIPYQYLSPKKNYDIVSKTTLSETNRLEKEHNVKIPQPLTPTEHMKSEESENTKISVLEMYNDDNDATSDQASPKNEDNDWVDESDWVDDEGSNGSRNSMASANVDVNHISELPNTGKLQEVLPSRDVSTENSQVLPIPTLSQDSKIPINSSPKPRLRYDSQSPVKRDKSQISNRKFSIVNGSVTFSPEQYNADNSSNLTLGKPSELLKRSEYNLPLLQAQNSDNIIEHKAFDSKPDGPDEYTNSNDIRLPNSSSAPSLALEKTEKQLSTPTELKKSSLNAYKAFQSTDAQRNVFETTEVRSSSPTSYHGSEPSSIRSSVASHHSLLPSGSPPKFDANRVIPNNTGFVTSRSLTSNLSLPVIPTLYSLNDKSVMDINGGTTSLYEFKSDNSPDKSFFGKFKRKKDDNLPYNKYLPMGMSVKYAPSNIPKTLPKLSKSSNKSNLPRQYSSQPNLSSTAFGNYLNDSPAQANQANIPCISQAAANMNDSNAQSLAHIGHQRHRSGSPSGSYQQKPLIDYSTDRSLPTASDGKPLVNFIPGKSRSVAQPMVKSISQPGTKGQNLVFRPEIPTSQIHPQSKPQQQYRGGDRRYQPGVPHSISTPSLSISPNSRQQYLFPNAQQNLQLKSGNVDRRYQPGGLSLPSNSQPTPQMRIGSPERLQSMLSSSQPIPQLRSESPDRSYQSAVGSYPPPVSNGQNFQYPIRNQQVTGNEPVSSQNGHVRTPSNESNSSRYHNKKGRNRSPLRNSFSSPDAVDFTNKSIYPVVDLKPPHN